MMEAPENNQSTPWDMQPDETSKAFHAFTVYRDLGPQERSLATAAAKLDIDKSQCGRWSSQFEWVRRVAAWDKEQDRQKLRLAAAEKERVQNRQLQQFRLATQAVSLPLITLTRRAQAKPDMFASIPDDELAKLSMSAARALPPLLAHERLIIGNPEEKLSELEKADSPQEVHTQIGVFRWVQTRCECGHAWDCHDQIQPDLARMPCGMRGCDCQKFVDTNQAVPEPPSSGGSQS